LPLPRAQPRRAVLQQVVLVKAQVRVAFISEGRAQPIPKSLRLLLKADVI